MEKAVYVVGHKRPDTDSICAALAYAELKNSVVATAAVQNERYVAARASEELWPETEWVLERFGLAPPALLQDAHRRVADVMKSDVLKVTADTPLFRVGSLMQQNNVKTAAVVDRDDHLLGVCTVGDIAKRYLEGYDPADPGPGMTLSIDNLLATLTGRVFASGTPETASTLGGRIVVCAMAVETMRRYLKLGDVVIVGDRADAQLAAIEAGAECLIVTGGLDPADEALGLARQRGVWVLGVPHDTFATARLVHLCLPVSLSMTIKTVSFGPEERVDEIVPRMIKQRHRSYPVVDDENRLVGLLSRGSLIERRSKQLILVDHNEKSQAVDGVEEADILEVIDHHRVGDIQTVNPILMRCEPLGSTCTLVATLFEDLGVEPSRPIAGAMLAAILSDTLIFRSPTATPRDNAVARRLAQKVGVDPVEFGLTMFREAAARTPVEPARLIGEDLKEFALKKGLVAISQVQTLDASALRERRAEILRAMERLREARGYRLFIVMVTDIWKEGTYLFASGEELSPVEEALGQRLVDGEMFLPGVMSRKKQVVPPLATRLEAEEM